MQELKNYWLKQSSLLNWSKKPTKVFTRKKNNYFEWFKDGKLNLAYNCLDKNIAEGYSNKKAIIFVNKEFKIKSFTYKELFILVEKFSLIINEYLTKKKKLSVIIHSSASIESAISMLACSRLGVHFSVIFEDLPKEAITMRIKLLKSNLIITRSSEDEINKKFGIIKKKSYVISFSKDKSAITRGTLSPPIFFTG